MSVTILKINHQNGNNNMSITTTNNNNEFNEYIS